MISVWLGAVLLGWAAPASDAASPSSTRPCDGVVEGQIVDGSTAEPIPAARVELRGTNAGALATTTDDAGHFRLVRVCDEAWSLDVSRVDYVAYRRRGRGAAQVDITLEALAVERLDDVVVEAPAPIPGSRGLTSTLDGDALERSRGQSFADSLARVPGVAVLRTAAGGLGKPIVRGQVGRRNLILFDGVRHEGQQWGIDHAPEIDPWSIGRITVVKGAGTVRDGSEASGGVVRIDPIAMPTTPGIAGQVDLLAERNGRRGTAVFRLDAAPRRIPGLALRVEGNLGRGAALVTPDYPLDNTGLWTWNAGGRLHYTRRHWALELSVRHHFMKAGICTCLRTDATTSFADVVVRDRPVGVELYSNEYRLQRPYQHVAHDLAMARTRVDAKAAGEVQITYAFQDDRRDEFELTRQALVGPQYRFRLRTHQLEAVLEQRPIAIGAHSVLSGQIGVVGQHQRNRFDGRQTLIPSYGRWTTGVFVHERWARERVEVEIGARYDAMLQRATLTPLDYRGQVATGQLEPERCEAEADGAAACRHRFHTGSASVGTVIRPIRRTPEFTVRADVTSTGRVPAIDELYLNGSAPSFPALGFGRSSLGVERTWGFALTPAFANAWISAEGAAFANVIEDYIYFSPRPAGGMQEGIAGSFPVFVFRPIDALFYGGELGFRIVPPRSPIEVDGQASWVRARELAGGDGLMFIPPDRYRLGVTYHWPDVWRLRGGYVTVRGSFIDRARQPSPDDFAPPPAGYGLLEAETGAEVEAGRQRLRLAIAGGNLTNSRYREYTSLVRYFVDEPGWQLTVRLSLAFHGPAGSPPANRH